LRDVKADLAFVQSDNFGSQQCIYNWDVRRKGPSKGWLLLNSKLPPFINTSTREIFIVLLTGLDIIPQYCVTIYRLLLYYSFS
jgi:hypothetical protein